MKNKFLMLSKQIAVMAVAALMLLGTVFIASGCASWRSYEFSEDDFELTITANRTYVTSYRDSIEVTVTFINLSEYTIPVFYRPILDLTPYSIHVWPNVRLGVFNSHLTRATLKPNTTTTVIKIVHLSISVEEDFEIFASVSLSIGNPNFFQRYGCTQRQNELLNNSQRIELYSNTILIQFLPIEENTYET